MAQQTQVPTTTPIPQPEKLTSVKGIFDLWWKKQALGFESCLPAIFLGYVNDDRSTGMAWVLPLVNKKLPSGETVERGSITLPVHHLQHGTFMIDAPLVKGDTGWIIAGDRENMAALDENAQIQAADSDIGKKDAQGRALGNSGPQPPAVNDTHKYLYGFFMPDKWGGIPLPEKFKDSLVIGQVSPDATSHGRYVMDPDGTIHVLSQKWYDAKDQKLKGGAVFVDLAWKGKLPTETKETWRLGDLTLRGFGTVLGDLTVGGEWMDEDGEIHQGGNLIARYDATVDGKLDVKGGASVESGLAVDGNSDFNGNIHIHDNTSRTVDIEPGVLVNGNAKFVKREILTGKDENRSHDGKVYLSRETVFVLSDPGVPMDPVEIAGVGGGGGDVDVDDISIKWHKKSEGEGDELAVKGWHNQKDINGDGELPEGETEQGDNDPEDEGGDLSLESMIVEGRGEGYSGYQVVARKVPGGPLVYIPIGLGGGSSGGESSEESGESSEEPPYSPEIVIEVKSEYTPPTTGSRGYTDVTLTPIVDGVRQQPHTFRVYDGNDGVDGDDGVGIASIVSGTPYQDGDYTVTPVTVTLTNGQVQNLTVRAKNGLDGDDGKDAGVVITTTPITGNPSGTRVTLTPTQGGVPDPAGAQTFDVMNGRDGGTGTITGSFSVVGDVQYNMSQTPPRLQKRIDTVTVVNGAFVQTPGSWVDFATPIAHSQTII